MCSFNTRASDLKPSGQSQTQRANRPESQAECLESKSGSKDHTIHDIPNANSPPSTIDQLNEQMVSNDALPNGPVDMDGVDPKELTLAKP